MSVLSRSKVIKSLCKKGFKKNKSGDHTYFHYYHEGKNAGIHTWVSHGGSHTDIDVSLQKQMKNQLRLSTVKDFQDLINCPMKEEQYRAIIISAGYLK